MSSAAAQAYLNTRVSVMATGLFGAETLDRLAEMQLPEVAERFSLPALLDDLHSPQTRSRAVEQGLIQVLFAELQVLVRPMQAEERAVVLAWARKYALFNLKAVIRGKLHDLDQAEIRDNLYDLPPDIRLPDEEMLRSENVLELLRDLEAGPYRWIARPAREIYEQKREPFALEATIDQRYHTGLLRQVMRLSDDSLQPLRRLVGAELDRVALMWLLRFRFSYQLSPSETFFELVPSPRLLNRERLLALVNIDSFPGVLEALPPPLNALLADSGSLIEVQQRINRQVCDEARRVLRRSVSGVGRALAYLKLRETDLLLLLAVVQGRLLNLSQAVVGMALKAADPRAHRTAEESGRPRGGPAPASSPAVPHSRSPANGA